MIKKQLSAAAISAVLVAGTALTGCSAVEVKPPIKSCHDYRVNSKFGKFHIQQASKGKSIAWGAYPNGTYSGTQYHVETRIDGHKLEVKNQSYAPHGSVAATKAKKYSGKVFVVAGNVKRNGKVILVYSMECRAM